MSLVFAAIAPHGTLPEAPVENADAVVLEPPLGPFGRVIRVVIMLEDHLGAPEVIVTERAFPILF